MATANSESPNKQDFLNLYVMLFGDNETDISMATSVAHQALQNDYIVTGLDDLSSFYWARAKQQQLPPLVVTAFCIEWEDAHPQRSDAYYF